MSEKEETALVDYSDPKWTEWNGSALTNAKKQSLLQLAIQSAIETGESPCVSSGDTMFFVNCERIFELEIRKTYELSEDDRKKLKSSINDNKKKLK